MSKRTTVAPTEGLLHTCALPRFSDFGRPSCEMGAGRLREIRWVLRVGDPATHRRLTEHLTWYTTAPLYVVPVESSQPGRLKACDYNGEHYLTELAANQARFVNHDSTAGTHQGWYLPNMWLVFSGTSHQAQFLINDKEQVLAARQCEYGSENGATGKRLLTLAEFLGHGYRFNKEANSGGLEQRGREAMSKNMQTLDALLNPQPKAPEVEPVGW